MRPSSSSSSSSSDGPDANSHHPTTTGGVTLLLRAHADEAALARTLEAHERLLLLRRREQQQGQGQQQPPPPQGGNGHTPSYAALVQCRNLLLQDGAFPQGWCSGARSSRGDSDDAACWLLLPLTAGAQSASTAPPTLLLSQWMAARPPLTRALHAHRALLRERERRARRRAWERRRQRQEQGKEEDNEEGEDEGEEDDEQEEPLPSPPPGINSLAVAEDLATRLRIAVQVWLVWDIAGWLWWGVVCCKV